MSQHGSVEVIEAAGGLVWREDDDGKKIVIVHRSKRYGDEWVLPKGKREEGQTWLETAIDEIKQETGCNNLDILSFAGGITYKVKDTPKTVLFWNMKITQECNFEPSEEVDKMQWVSPKEALKLLRYPKERALLHDASCILDRNPVFMLGWMKRFKSTSHSRLDTALGPFEQELKSLIENKVASNEPTFPWAEYSLQMVNCAKQALELGEIQLGWRYYLQAELLRLYLFKPDRLKGEAQSTLNEAEEKLSSWRKKTVQHLLGKEGELKKSAENPTNVFVARKILQEHQSNTYIKIGTAQMQLRNLSLAGVILLIPLLILIPRISGNDSFLNFSTMLTSIFLGAAGGAFSGIISVSWGSKKEKIPSVILNSWITLSRPIVGAISALGVLLFLDSGLIHLGTDKTQYIYVISFAAGFSERLVISAVDKIS